VIQIDVPVARLVDRLTGRRVCKNCGAVYHVEFNPPRQPGVCDVCGGQLVQREDDTEKVVRARIRTYDDLTEPLAAHYRAKGILRDVYASGHIEEVHQRILEALRK